jgi:hypothetical protein
METTRVCKKITNSIFIYGFSANARHGGGVDGTMQWLLLLLLRSRDRILAVVCG